MTGIGEKLLLLTAARSLLMRDLTQPPIHPPPIHPFTPPNNEGRPTPNEPPVFFASADLVSCPPPRVRHALARRSQTNATVPCDRKSAP